MSVKTLQEDTVFTVSDFDLAQTFGCGQCFRFSESGGVWSGIAGGRLLRARQEGDRIVLLGIPREDYETFWTDYFDLATDYGAIKRSLSTDPVLRRACGYGCGIRILRQEPFEALISFILSQNNNIKRIRGIVERLCEAFGEPVAGGYAFPTPQRLAAASQEELSVLRAGFRAKYLSDAAQKTASGEIDPDRVAALPFEEARAELMKISGVGPKVADCVLLFGFHRLEAFPMDVWMKRAMQTLLPDGLPDCALSCAGIAQQYLFHYVKEGDGLEQLP